MQAKALGYPDLPIAVVPHPFGMLRRDQIHEVARKCAADIAALLCKGTDAGVITGPAAAQSALVAVSEDHDAINALFRERRWSDGLPVVPPTRERVSRMLRSTARRPEEIIAYLAPGFGAATVERIAVNAVMAGCEPDYLPVLLAAVEAVAAPEFNLQGIQSTTHSASVWLIVSGPVARALGMNAGPNCLGQGNWANATLGRALRLILQNVGRAWPGEMDRATAGQPGKYSFCCAENEAESPWEPLHVERGLSPEQSAVTVVGAEGTTNMNIHSKNADQMLSVFADSMQRPAGNDFRTGGDPWVILSPEHAGVLQAAGLSKADVKQRLWDRSKLRARRMTDLDLEHAQHARRPELGEIFPDTMLPICTSPGKLGIIVAGGPGTHSVYVASFGNTCSVTREVMTGAIPPA